MCISCYTMRGRERPNILSDNTKKYTMLFIIGLLLGGVVVVFVVQNIIPVSVNFLTWQFDGSLAVVLILAVIAGILISWFLALPDIIRREFKVSDLRKHNRKLEEELEVHKKKLSDTQDKIVEMHSEPVVIEKTTVIETDSNRIS